MSDPREIAEAALDHPHDPIPPHALDALARAFLAQQEELEAAEFRLRGQREEIEEWKLEAERGNTVTTVCSNAWCYQPAEITNNPSRPPFCPHCKPESGYVNAEQEDQRQHDSDSDQSQILGSESHTSMVLP